MPGNEMDWLSLTANVLTKKRVETGGGGEWVKNGGVKVGIRKEESVADAPGNFEKVQARLDPLEAAAVSCVLEIASLQLYIIDVGTCSSSPDRSNKIARQKVMEVIEKTREEVLEKGTFEVLVEKGREEAEAVREEKLLLDSLLKNQVRIEELKSSLKRQESTKQRDMNEKQEVIASLKDTIHEEITKCEAKLQYVDRWEAARQGQHRMRCLRAELDLERKLEEVTRKSDNEIRVHDEICTFMALEEKVLSEEVEKWRETYEKEMKRRTEKIKVLEVRRKEQEILRYNLLELYEDRQKEINDYLDLKEKIRKEMEQSRFVNEMATKIQAWWRGTMVRRGLGPYKKRKKEKKGKEKKK